MKSLDIDAMSNAIKKIVSLCGIEVLEDIGRFQAAVNDVMRGSLLNTERQLLIFAIWIGVGKKMFKGVKQSASVQKRMLINVNTMLTVEYGFTQKRSENLLEVFVTALGWNRGEIVQCMQSLGEEISDENVFDERHSYEKDQHEYREFVKGTVVPFGKYMWRVLYVNEKAALLLADEITDIGIPYNKELDATSWEKSWVRKWLNTEFLQRFSKKQQKRIVMHRIRAEANPWYQTDAGSSTVDKVFLLSVLDIIRNFGDSGQLKNRSEKVMSDMTDSDRMVYVIDDRYNERRQAMYKGEKTWWWLRSPGDSQYKAAYINADGIVFLNGELVVDDGGSSCVDIRPGIRPAIWLRK